MLIGRAVHNLDTKGRIVIPARYRDDFGASIFALYGVKGCIRLYNREEFEKLTEKVMSGDINRDAFRRKVFGSVELVSFDAQGRILLTEDLRKKQASPTRCAWWECTTGSSCGTRTGLPRSRRS